MKSNPHRQVWLLAWPMIVSNLTVPLLGLVDTAILGHLSHAHYLGAVALGAIIFDMLFWAFGFLRMGTTGLTAQSYGANDTLETQSILFRSLILATLIGFGLILLQAPLFDLAFWYMSPSADVEEYARLYCNIRIYAAPATLSNYVIVGWLLSIGKTRQVLLLALITNLINLSLDYWLVVHQGMLTEGVALGSLIASISALLVGAFMVSRALSGMPEKMVFSQLFEFKRYLTLLKVNRYIFIRTLCLLFTFSFFYAQSAQQDTVTLSANAVLMTMLMVFSYGQDGFANAAEVLSGRAIGAKQLTQFYRVNRATAQWFFLTTVLFIIIIAVFDELIIGLLTNIPEVVNTTLAYWPWLLLIPIIATWNFLLDGIFVGAAKARAMQNTMLISSFFVFLPSWLLFSDFDNHGLWLAFCFFHAARSISMALVYYYYTRQKQWIVQS